MTVREREARFRELLFNWDSDEGELLERLRGNPTRGDVVATIQKAVMETLEDVAAELCAGDHSRDECRLKQDDPDGEGLCGASALWAAWANVELRLWGTE